MEQRVMHACAAPPSDAEANAPRSCNPRWRAHDLLRIARLPDDEHAPDWLRDAYLRAPFAVVRRAPAAHGFVAVGLRGTTRSQRFGTWVVIANIEAGFAPETLIETEPTEGRRVLPAFNALARLRDTRSALHEFVWGPTGSAGFELATRSPTVSETSDLDLLIRMPDRCETATIRALTDALAHAASHAQIRIDVQLETPAGGVALAELAAGRPRVLARASDGARLVVDPWHPA